MLCSAATQHMCLGLMAQWHQRPTFENVSWFWLDPLPLCAYQPHPWRPAPTWHAVHCHNCQCLRQQANSLPVMVPGVIPPLASVNFAFLAVAVEAVIDTCCQRGKAATSILLPAGAPHCCWKGPVQSFIPLCVGVEMSCVA